MIAMLAFLWTARGLAGPVSFFIRSRCAADSGKPLGVDLLRFPNASLAMIADWFGLDYRNVEKCIRELGRK